MRIREIKTNRFTEVNDSYAARLIEQGRAVPAPAKKEAPRKAKEAPTAKKAVTSDGTAG